MEGSDVAMVNSQLHQIPATQYLTHTTPTHVVLTNKQTDKQTSKQTEKTTTTNIWSHHEIAAESESILFSPSQDGKVEGRGLWFKVQFD